MGRIGISNLIAPSRKSAAVALVGAAVCPMLATAFSLPVSADSASSLNASVGATLVYGGGISVSSSGSIAVELLPTSNGSLAVGKDQVGVVVDDNEPWQLYISGTSVDTNNYTALYLNGNSAYSAKLQGIPASVPESFADTNQWGVAVPANSAGGFSATQLYENALTAGTIIDEPTINGLKWMGVDASQRLLRSSTGAGQTDVYYGFYADSTLITGNYRNVITYTAFVEGTTGDRVAVLPSTAKVGDTLNLLVEYSGDKNTLNLDQLAVSLYKPTNDETIAACTNLAFYDSGVANLVGLTCDIDKITAASTISKGVQYGVKVDIDFGNGTQSHIWNADAFAFSSITMSDLTYMQAMSTNTCTDTPYTQTSGTTYTLADSRDGKKYLIRKLTDNHCWMVQNLALAGDTTLTSADTNLPDGVTYTTPNGDVYTGKFAANNAEHMYNGKHLDATNDNTTTNTGAYYNWNVATAGYDTANAKSSGNSDRSICPKNWRLPTSNSGGEFEKLYQAYNSNKTTLDSAFNLTAYVGNYSSGALFYSGSSVYWWSSTINSATYAYGLSEYSSGNISPSNGSNRYAGFSVRCVAQ